MTESERQSFTLTYDPEAGIAYLYNRGRHTQKGVVERTVEFDDGRVYIDYDKEGSIFGIEILNPDKITLSEIMRRLEPPIPIDQWAEEQHPKFLENIRAHVDVLCPEQSTQEKHSIVRGILTYARQEWET